MSVSFYSLRDLSLHGLHFTPNRSSAQIKLKREVYFNPGAGAELGVTTLLECSEIDAEGEDDDDDDTDFVSALLILPSDIY